MFCALSFLFLFLFFLLKRALLLTSSYRSPRVAGNEFFSGKFLEMEWLEYILCTFSSILDSSKLHFKMMVLILTSGSSL